MTSGIIKHTILVTGFEPFGGQSINPALEAVKLLPHEIDGCTVKSVSIPVSYSASYETLRNYVEEFNPEFVIMVGQAAGRDALTVERIAINIDDCASPDNDDDVRENSFIDDNGPDAIFATIPVCELVRDLKNKGIKAEVSNTAGTYVCNHLMYEMLNHSHEFEPYPHAGFVHVPLIPEQTATGDMEGKPSMPLEDVVAGLTELLKFLPKAYNS